MGFLYRCYSLTGMSTLTTLFTSSFQSKTTDCQAEYMNLKWTEEFTNCRHIFCCFFCSTFALTKKPCSHAGCYGDYRNMVLGYVPFCAARNHIRVLSVCMGAILLPALGFHRRGSCLSGKAQDYRRRHGGPVDQAVRRSVTFELPSAPSSKT